MAQIGDIKRVRYAKNGHMGSMNIEGCCKDGFSGSRGMIGYQCYIDPQYEIVYNESGYVLYKIINGEKLMAEFVPKENVYKVEYVTYEDKTKEEVEKNIKEELEEWKNKEKELTPKKGGLFKGYKN